MQIVRILNFTILFDLKKWKQRLNIGHEEDVITLLGLSITSFLVGSAQQQFHIQMVLLLLTGNSVCYLTLWKLETEIRGSWMTVDADHAMMRPVRERPFEVFKPVAAGRLDESAVEPAGADERRFCMPLAIGRDEVMW